jgi:hypothetical protein
LDEEGYALRLPRHEGHERHRRLLSSEGTEQVADVVLWQPLEGEALHIREPGEPVEDPSERLPNVELRVPIGTDHQQRHVVEAAANVLDKQGGRLVRPMQVIEHEHRRLHGCRSLEVVADAGEQIVPGLLRRQLLRRTDLGEDLPQTRGDT